MYTEYCILYALNVMAVMMLASLILFTFIAACCEYVLWKHLVSDVKRRWIIYTYGFITGSLWLVTIIAMTGFWWGTNIGNCYTRFLGAVLVVFLFNGTAKTVYVFLALIGKLTGTIRVMRIVAWAVIAFLAALILYGMTAGRSRLRVEEEIFISSRVPPAFDGFRIVIFSDVHTGLLFGRDRMLTDMVEAINVLDADIVVNCGDLVNYDYRELDGKVMEILSGMESRLGVYSVLGNHDLGIYIRDTSRYGAEDNVAALTAVQRSLGWHLLRDSSIMIRRGSDTLSITGLDFPSSLIRRSHNRADEDTDVSPAYANVPTGMFNITLSHAPQSWDAVRKAGRGDVTLSGHVHSLQLKLSLGRWSWSPAAWLYDRWSGAYREGENLLYINDGIGYAMIPVRIGTKPEITLLELKVYENSCIGRGIE